MLIVDLNSIGVLHIMSWVRKHPNEKLDAAKIYDILDDALTNLPVKIQGRFIIAGDSRSYWRKDIFPHYKHARKKVRREDKSDVNWKLIFDTLNDYAEAMPWGVIVDGAEADDIIAVMVKRYASEEENTIIVSSDKDLCQLQKYPKVQQFTPYFNRFISIPKPEEFLLEHIIRGDAGDGIPNILSPDDCFFKGERQKRLNSNKIKEWIESGDLELRGMDGFIRNQKLIDLDFIPREVVNRIEATYDAREKAQKTRRKS